MIILMAYRIYGYVEHRSYNGNIFGNPEVYLYLNTKFQENNFPFCTLLLAFGNNLFVIHTPNNIDANRFLDKKVTFPEIPHYWDLVGNCSFQKNLLDLTPNIKINKYKQEIKFKYFDMVDLDPNSTEAKNRFAQLLKKD